MTYPAALTVLARAFGSSMTILKHRPELPSAEHVAANWLNLLRNGNPHESVKVFACDATIDPSEPLGMPLIDNLISRSSSISSGNIYSNVQFSQILPARAKLEVNGFRALDARYIQPGDLFERTLQLYVDAVRKSMGPNYSRALEASVRRAAAGVDADTAVTVHSFQHQRADKSGLLPHGCLVVSDQGKLLARFCTGESPYSERLLEAATKILTFERTNERLLFDYQDKQVVYATPEVKKLALALYERAEPEADAAVCTPAPGGA